LVRRLYGPIPLAGSRKNRSVAVPPKCFATKVPFYSIVLVVRSERSRAAPPPDRFAWTSHGDSGERVPTDFALGRRVRFAAGSPRRSRHCAGKACHESDGHRAHL
jgi:hypothetical protein